MVSRKKNSWEAISLFLLFSVFMLCFIYFRVSPIINQTVPYTYDQGRDFLKAHEIIHNHNLTLIGPTTGINGLFHGVWWYYFLAIPYLIFQGNPLGFYIFIFLSMLFFSILSFLFIRKEFNAWTAIFFLGLSSISPYFIFSSFFPSNSILVIPFLLLLFYAIYQFLIYESEKAFLLIFFSIGMILEAELAFGLFLIPAFFVTMIITRMILVFFDRPSRVFSGALAFCLAVLPRIVFELKNHFLQSQTFLNFFIKPSATNRTSFNGVFNDRLGLFWNYYISFFPEEYRIVSVFLSCVAIFFLVIGYSKLDVVKRKFTLFLIVLFGMLFTSSLLYRNNFFWPNYFEGLPLFYLLFITVSFYSMTKKIPARVYRLFPLLLLVFGLFLVFKDRYKPSQKIGIIEQIDTVNYIYSRTEKNNVCVRVYTPPVIAYTYNYLFTYYSNAKKYPFPSHDFIRDRCYYIIEKDDYKFRVDKWREENIPVSGILVEKHTINPSIKIELWQEHAK